MSNCPFAFNLGTNRHGLPVPHRPGHDAYLARKAKIKKLAFLSSSLYSMEYWLKSTINSLHETRTEHFHPNLNKNLYGSMFTIFEHPSKVTHEKEYSTVLLSECPYDANPDITLEIKFTPNKGYQLTWSFPWWMCRDQSESNGEDKRVFTYEFSNVDETEMLAMEHDIMEVLWMDNHQCVEELHRYLVSETPKPKFNWAFKEGKEYADPKHERFLTTQVVTTHAPFKRDEVGIHCEIITLGGIKLVTLAKVNS